MPRMARMDTPGALHHVISRGMARCRIFLDRSDYESFIERLGRILVRGRGRCLAWALMPNHFHLLLLTGEQPLKQVMQRLLTGYSMDFNRAHRRSGRLFQNRYKSILCERDEYLIELVRYIHLNPLRAGLVKGLKELEDYPWCGHGVVTGKREAPWQDVKVVLAYFGGMGAKGKEKYEAFVSEGAVMGRRPELVGGGVVRSAGGWVEYIEQRKEGVRHEGDERILGSSEFVSKVFREAKEKERRWSWLRREGWSPGRVIARAAELAGIKADEVYGSGKHPKQCRARGLVCKWLVEDLGYTTVEVSNILRITQPAVSVNVRRGHDLSGQLKVRLEGKTA